jgi:type IV secretory pathway VirB6-like protein
LNIVSEAIDEVSHIAGLFFCYGRIARQAQFLTMDTFCDRKRQLIPFFIPLLFMRRNGIVYLGFHAMIQEILPQLIAAGTEHREDVKD